MAYMNKRKKKYKLNRNAPKAQEGIATVGQWAEHVWDGIVDTIQNINLNAPQIDFGGGARKGGEGPGGESASEGDKYSSDYVPSSKTDYSNLTRDDLEWMHGRWYDFGRLDDLLQNNPNQRGGATGRRFDMASLYHTPENINFDFDVKKGNQKSGREQGFRVGDKITNTHPQNLSAILMDALYHDPLAIQTLKRNSFNNPKRKDAVTNLNKKHGLPEGAIKGDNRWALRDIDEDAWAREMKKLDAKLKGTGSKNYKGPAYDVYLMNELLGPYLPKGMVIDPQMAQFMNKFLGDGLFTDAAAAMHPDIFDPGVAGGGRMEDGTYSPYRTRNKPSAGFDKFINAPQNYIYNLEASGYSPDDRPSQEWLHMQHLSNQGAKDGMGGYNKHELAQMLMQDKDFLAKNALNRNEIYRISELDNWGVFHKGEDPNVFKFGVSWDDKNQRWYSEGTKDWLTDKQAAALERNITQKYIEDSGWQQFDPQHNIEPVTIGHVPSGKTEGGQMPTPGGPLGFTNTGDDIETDINEFNQGVDVSGGAEGGETEGGGAVETTGGGRGKSRERRSMDAILDSVTSGTHVVTGENYNESDLKRDSAIIKREFGDDAYNTLLSELMNVDTGQPGSEETVVNQGGGERPTNELSGINRRNLNFTGGDFNQGFNQDEDENEMSIYEQVQRLRNPDDYEDDDYGEEYEPKDARDNKSDVSQASKGFTEAEETKDAGTGGGYSPFPDQMSYEEMVRMMSLGETPVYKHGGFGKGFDMNKMKFYNKGGKTLKARDGANFSSVASAFGGGGGGGTGVRGFNIAPIYNEKPQDPLASGEIYLNTKLLRLQKELSGLDPNDPANQDAIAALMQEIEESKAELSALRGGGPGTAY